MDPLSFLGKGWAFPVRVGSRGGVEMAAGEDDIAQSIEIILRTAPGERVMLPTFGCGLQDLVFAPLNHQTLARVGPLVRDALRDWEPRIEVESVEAEADQAENNRLFISIKYRVRATNARGNLVYPFYLSEGGGV